MNKSLFKLILKMTYELPNCYEAANETTSQEEKESCKELINSIADSLMTALSVLTSDTEKNANND